MTPLASTTEPEGRGWGGLSAFALGSPGARRPQTGRRAPSATAARGGVWRSSGRPIRHLPEGLAKESESPWGTAGPKANSRGRPGWDAQSRPRASLRESAPSPTHRPSPPRDHPGPPRRTASAPQPGVTPGRPQAPASGRALRPRDRAAGQPAPRPASRPLRPRLLPRFPRPGLPAQSRGRRRALPGLERRKDLARQGVAARRAGSAAGESRW